MKTGARRGIAHYASLTSKPLRNGFSFASRLSSLEFGPKPKLGTRNSKLRGATPPVYGRSWFLLGA
jgi:hypothetical protein